MKDEIIKKLKDYNQTHITGHIDTLTEKEKVTFLNHLAGLDIDLVFKLYKDFQNQNRDKKDTYITPASVITTPKTDDEIAFRNKAKKVGENIIRENKVAVLIVAGGQGTRLGFYGPKGTFKISPVMGKSFFQLFSEQIIALSRKYNTIIPLLIMTSEENDEDTRTFFYKNNYFGLENDRVLFFKQGMLPSLTLSGELVLKDRYELATNPDGHGGSLKAIYKSGILERLTSQGYSDLFYCQVDNPLVRILDPVFLGYHKLTGSEVSTKVVRRRDIEEKVGVYVTLNGKDAIIEYSDMDKTYMEAVDENGEIVYWPGNTAIHAFSLDFIKRLNNHGFGLPYHRAMKKTEVKIGDCIREIDVLKFETFVFDAIPLASKACAVEILREEEFSPVKNKEGIDSPETAQKDMVNMFKKWLESAGAEVKAGVKIEISPLYALDYEDFVKKFNGKGLIIDKDTYIED